MDTSFADAALLLIGHGSTLHGESAAPVWQHAAELRQRGLFDEVREAFWKVQPGIRGVLASLAATRIFAVPLFISEGYFTEEVIPRELGLSHAGEKAFTRIRRLEPGERTLSYCAPVGTHPSMTSVILDRAREVLENHPFPCAPLPGVTGLVIAGHGTNRNENSRLTIERQAERIRALNRFEEVQAVFMEEKPAVADVYHLVHARNVVVVPFLISDGLHASQDIPVMLGEPERLVKERLAAGQPAWRNPTERQGKRLWYARSVGSEPHLSDVIMERVREAAGWASPPAI